jgi:hypothetical protein
MAHSNRNRLGTIDRTELAHRRLFMLVDRPLGNGEDLSDLPRRFALRGPSKDLAFALVSDGFSSSPAI